MFTPNWPCPPNQNHQNLLDWIQNWLQLLAHHQTCNIIQRKRTKGQMNNLNNYCGICLKETMAKIVSSFIASWLLSVFKTHGCSSQFSHTGCQEPLQILRLALTIRCHHGKETYALIINLIKAFDSINHDLLLKLLSRYGMPKTLIDIIKKLYQNCSIQFQVNSEKKTASYNKSVQQGDSMVPILFLFIMQAAHELIKKNLPPKHLNSTTSLILLHMIDSLAMQRFHIQHWLSSWHRWWLIPLLNPQRHRTSITNNSRSSCSSWNPNAHWYHHHQVKNKGNVLMDGGLLYIVCWDQNCMCITGITSPVLSRMFFLCQFLKPSESGVFWPICKIGVNKFLQISCLHSLFSGQTHGHWLWLLHYDLMLCFLLKNFSDWINDHKLWSKGGNPPYSLPWYTNFWTYP